MAAIMATPLRDTILSPARPRLTLQTNTISLNLGMAKSRALPAATNSSTLQSPTHFGSSHPSARSLTPITAINTRVHSLTLDTAMPSSVTPPAAATATTSTAKRVKLSLQTARPHFGKIPETPVTARPECPAAMRQPQPQPRPIISAAATMATPPLSPADESSDSDESSFDLASDSGLSMPAAHSLRHRWAAPSSAAATPAAAATTPPPYTHPRALRSILRNSPLRTDSSSVPAALSASQPASRPRERPVKRVCYNTPLTQTITNCKYTISHMDLLFDEDSAGHGDDADPADAMAYTEDEVRDGGSTPGPFSDPQRRMACLLGSMAAASAASAASVAPVAPAVGTLRPSAGGVRKRKRKEKPRRWVWTIGVEDEEEDEEDKIGGAVAALRAADAAAAAQTITVCASNLRLPPRVDVFLRSPTPTPSLVSSPESMELDDEDDVCEMELDTPRAAIHPLSAVPFGSMMAEGGAKSSCLHPGIWHQPDTPLRMEGRLLGLV